MSQRPTYGFAIRPRAVFAALLLGGCCLCKSSTSTGPSAPTVSPAVGPLLAGAATVAITLPNGTPLAGYGGAPRRHLTPANILLAATLLGTGTCIDPTPGTAAVFFEPSTGTKDALSARALVLANPSRKAAIVKVDAIGMSRKLRDDLVAAALPLGIPAPYLVVVATHTHSGPGSVSDQLVWEIAASDCFRQSVYDAVKNAAVDALTQANAARQPADIGFATSTVTGANRSRLTPPGPVDARVGLIKVISAGAGAPIAALFNFAVHGTSHGAGNMEFSADCMGAMEDQVAAKTGAVAIFTNGAEGDVAPMHIKDAGVALEGQLVGDHVDMMWQGLTSLSSTVDLRAAFDVVEMPPPQYNPNGCLPLADGGATLCDITGSPVTVPLPGSWLSTELPFQALRINKAVLIALPGEPVTDLGTELKTYAAAQGFTEGTFILSLANDHGGYFTTRAQYQAGTYEGTATLYGENTGPFVVQEAKKVIDRVK